MTPAQRRFLGTPLREERAERKAPVTPEEPPHEQPSPGEVAEPSDQISESKQVATPPPDRALPEVDEPLEEVATPVPGRERQPPRLKLDDKVGRQFEMMRAVMVLGALLSLCIMFYVGRNFEHWKYWLFTGRNEAKLEETVPDKFPGVASDELFWQAVDLQRAGQTQEAIDRFLAAKRKNLGLRGILYRTGKLVFDAKDFDSADTLFERAIAFGENLDAANFHRGLIAIRRKDLSAARRFFEAAAAADPFTGDHRYYLGEVLRLDHDPTAAMAEYRRAAALARSPLETTVCGFKIRMARLEAAESSKVAEELAEKEKTGPLPVDWLMTAAALHIRQGDVGEGLRFLVKAREGTDPGVFVSCVTDLFFRRASEVHPTVAEVTRLEFNPTAPFQ
jgi:hypothetical protein